jgi:di/tricarboxylate transporter
MGRTFAGPLRIMIWEAWLVVAVIGIVLALLMHGRVAADIVIVGAVSFLVVFDQLVHALIPGRTMVILSTKDALAGMANEGMLTVAVMYVVVCGLTETGAVGWIGEKVLGRPTSVLGAQLRMLFPVAGLSAVMNNTPLVAMFIPVVNDWSKKYRISASKLMMPLSYAAILGGTCTLVGTSTNLVVNGLWQASGRPALGFFEIAWLGLPSALIGIVYLVIAGRWLLPERKPVLAVREDPRSYTVEMMVDGAGPLVGKTIEQAGLRNLPGLYLAEIERGGATMVAVGPQDVLFADDRLVFVGVVESVVDLQRIRGLAPATNQVVKLTEPRPNRLLTEAVVSNSSPLVGRTVKEGKFRSVYNAVVIAVARNGERVRGKIGDISLEVGDTLLLEAPPSFADRNRNSRDFYLVSAIPGSNPQSHDRARTALAILAGMIVLATVGERFGLSMFHAATVAAGAMLVSRCCRGPQARGSVDWQVLVVIAASLALGKALENTGAASVLGHSMIATAGGDPWLTLALVYGATMVMTELITNNAAAALMFPLAAAAATELGADFKPFVFCVMMAASASFSTPIGYQTNLMVMAPGGYRFSDYLRFGMPLNLLMWITGVALAPRIWPLFD